jgi:hypothetical protein
MDLALAEIEVHSLEGPHAREALIKLADVKNLTA